MDTYRQTEKAALIAVQSILNTRGTSPWEKINRLRLNIGQLPPPKALNVLTQILISFSERLDLSTPMSQWMKQNVTNFSKTVMGTHFEISPVFLTKKLYEIQTHYKRLGSCEFMDCGYNDENWERLLEVLITMAKRSADEASGISVLPMSTPAQALVLPPESPKKRPSAKNMLGLARARRGVFYHQTVANETNISVDH